MAEDDPRAGDAHSDSALLPEVTIHTPNAYPFFTRMRVTIAALLFQWVVDLLTIGRDPFWRRNKFQVRVPTPAGSCRVVVYLPSQPRPTEQAPGVVLHLHGGGWTIPEVDCRIMQYLADELNTAVVGPDYRLAPLYPFPHGLEQCFGVLKWIASGGLSLALSGKHEFAIDSSRIAISGGSAGSNLAAACSLLAIRTPLPGGARVAALGLLYPSLDLAAPYREKVVRVTKRALLLPAWQSRLFVAAYLPPPRVAADPRVSPARAPPAELARFPPTLVLTAAHDYLAWEADVWADALKAEGVEVTNRRFEHVGHGFDAIISWDAAQRKHNEEARVAAWAMIVDMFKAKLW